jgi:hypothetical protein
VRRNKDCRYLSLYDSSCRPNRVADKPPPDIDACVRFWQRELGLQKWKITTRCVSRRVLDPHTAGDIEPHFERKTAVLRLLQEEDSDLSPRMAKADQRLTIAHEMVHLRKFAAKDPQWGNERAVNTEAFQLVKKFHRWHEILAIDNQ